MNTVLTLIRNGGVMMYPLILCSVVMIALIIERAITLRKASVDGDALLDEIKTVRAPPVRTPTTRKQWPCARATGGTMSGACLRAACATPTAARTLSRWQWSRKPPTTRPTLEANLPIIKTIINIAPLLGLLGTIAGMISSFRAASQQGLSNPTAVLGGISEALISTATGITLAVVGFIFFNYFSNLGAQNRGRHGVLRRGTGQLSDGKNRLDKR